MLQKQTKNIYSLVGLFITKPQAALESLEANKPLSCYAFIGLRKLWCYNRWYQTFWFHHQGGTCNSFWGSQLPALEKTRDRWFKEREIQAKDNHWHFADLAEGFSTMFSWAVIWLLDVIGLFDGLQEWPGHSPFPDVAWGSDPLWCKNVATLPGAVHLGWFQALWPGGVQTPGDGTDCHPRETWIYGRRMQYDSFWVYSKKA